MFGSVVSASSGGGMMLRKLAARRKTLHTKHKRQRKLANEKGSKFAEVAGDSGGNAAETPGSRTLWCEHAGLSGVGLLEAIRVLGRNPSLGPQIRGDLARTGSRERKLKLDHVLGHVLHGSKPQETHQNERSIRGTK